TGVRGPVQERLLAQVVERELFAVRGERRQGRTERAHDVESHAVGAGRHEQERAANAALLAEVIDFAFAGQAAAAALLLVQTSEQAGRVGKARGRSRALTARRRRTND